MRRLINLARYRDSGESQHVRYFGFLEARSVVLEGQLVLGIVDAKAPQSVGIREFAKTSQLVVAQRSLQLVGDFHECHGGIIARESS